MGLYLNIGNSGFRSARKSEYVDKSGLIGVVNRTIGTERKFSCVTRCRRFGKSMAAKMLAAYYDESCDSRLLFSDLEIAKDPSFEEHLNKYPVIYWDMSNFTSRFHGNDNIVEEIKKALWNEIIPQYPDVRVDETNDLMDMLTKIAQHTGKSFILIIDEWDAICREFSPGSSAMDNYVGWLRRMFKSVNANDAFAAVYMTGILPIKKYKTESALNNFVEYSMVKPGPMSSYFGFTKDDVRALCDKHHMNFDEMEKWYDGYQIGQQGSMFNPNSVMMALWNGYCDSYWASTGAYDAVATYVQMNFEGLRDDIIFMLSGGRCPVNTTGFQNDMSIIRSKDDVLTVLIHLGYLAYDWNEEECYIPNKEVEGEMVNAVNGTNWTPVIQAIENSKRLLKAVLKGDEEAVARGLDAVHDESTSILSYNDENSLSCVISLAFYYAKNDYIVHRELTSGKGFADLVLIPRKHVASPALILELKFDKSADAAIDQIKRKQYSDKVAEYTGNMLLVGINYDRKTKQHQCKIEAWEK